MDKKNKYKYLSNIESYISGTLTQQEKDELWVEFLKDPQLYEYFITELHLQSLRKKGELPSGYSDSEGDRVSGHIQPYAIWKYAAVAILLLVASLQLFRAKDMTGPGFSALSLAEIHYTEMAGAAIYRSDNVTVSDLDVRINEGLALALEKNTDQAMDTFHDLIGEGLSAEQQIRVDLNLGILYYNQGNFQEAASYFQSVTELEESDKPLAEKGWWYLGNSLLQTGDKSGASEAVLHTVQMDGRFQKEASELLEKIDSM